MPNKKNKLLDATTLILCILIITIMVLICHSIPILLSILIFFIILYHYQNRPVFEKYGKLLLVILISVGGLMLLLTTNLLTTLCYSIKLIIVLSMILFYTENTTDLEKLESINIVSKPLSFFGLSPVQVSANTTEWLIYLSVLGETHQQIVDIFYLRGLDWRYLSWKGKYQYRYQYGALLKEKLQKRVRNLFDMLEIKLYRIQPYQKSGIFRKGEKGPMIAIGMCLLLFLMIVVKEVMI